MMDLEEPSKAVNSLPIGVDDSLTPAAAPVNPVVESLPTKMDGSLTPAAAPVNPVVESLPIGMDASLTPAATPVTPVVDTAIPTGESAIPIGESDMSTGESEVPADEEIGGVHESKDTGVGKQSCCRKHKLGIILLVITLLGVGGGGTAAWLLLTEKSKETPILLLENYDSSHSVSKVSENICYEWIPGEGKSGFCSTEETKQHGGALCNVVAKSLLHAVDSADIAIINAGVCRDDIAAGELTAGDISDAINPVDLTTVEMPGSAIIKVLEDALKSTFENDDGAAYPYAAGIRYNVEANLEYNSRVTGVEIFFDKAPIWIRINPDKFYKVVTTTSLVNGELGYTEFTKVIEAWKTPLSFQTGDAVFDYASKNATWSVLEADEYSTQSFVPASKIADVPNQISLADGGSCNLVAWALLDQVFRADIAILNAGVCGSNVRAGSFELADAQALIPKDPSLVTINLQGPHILDALEKGVDAFLSGRSNSYPYSAGLRFDVDARADWGSRVSNIETLDRSNRWTALLSSKTYTVLTTSDLASGKNNDYASFLEGDSSRPTSPSSAVDTFVAYATEWKVLYDPPQEKDSTQTYIA
jgi:2',3'-cyclic-nucleotide 2'-phosphodiesterase (5'-nucleotidase family)